MSDTEMWDTPTMIYRTGFAFVALYYSAVQLAFTEPAAQDALAIGVLAMFAGVLLNILTPVFGSTRYYIRNTVGGAFDD